MDFDNNENNDNIENHEDENSSENSREITPETPLSSEIRTFLIFFIPLLIFCYFATFHETINCDNSGFCEYSEYNAFFMAGSPLKFTKDEILNFSTEDVKHYAPQIKRSRRFRNYFLRGRYRHPFQTYFQTVYNVYIKDIGYYNVPRDIYYKLGVYKNNSLPAINYHNYRYGIIIGTAAFSVIPILMLCAIICRVRRESKLKYPKTYKML